ncbi:MAG TPA: sigma-70 family RNA polymerase sigma factor [Thermomicrobiales bacterium]|nr:sigma-70 family RNA polymerase sigma factor [Thermomicrobiales bacterium]
MSQQPQKVRRLPVMRRVADPAPPVETSDAELVHRVSLGDTSALEALYTRYARVVYSFAMRIVMDPMLAEEVLQEVFVRTWRQADRFQRSRGNFASWLLSITHNLAIDEVRKRQRRPQKSDAVDVSDALFGLVDEATNVEEAAEAADLRIRIRTAMVTLPEAQREAIELAFFAGLSQREISAHLDVPLGTIKTRMRLGLKKLRQELEAGQR